MHNNHETEKKKKSNNHGAAALHIQCKYIATAMTSKWLCPSCFRFVESDKNVLATDSQRTQQRKRYNNNKTFI